MTEATTRPFLQDVALRDGMHAIRHRIQQEDMIADIAVDLVAAR